MSLFPVTVICYACVCFLEYFQEPKLFLRLSEILRFFSFWTLKASNVSSVKRALNEFLIRKVKRKMWHNILKILKIKGKSAIKYNFGYYIYKGFGVLGVSVLATGTQVRGFKPGRSRRIFKGQIILSTPSFGREVKPIVPCRRLAACKRTAFRQNYRSLFPPINSNFCR
jgi:hypothetical protein